MLLMTQRQTEIRNAALMAFEANEISLLNRASAAQLTTEILERIANGGRTGDESWRSIRALNEQFIGNASPIGLDAWRRIDARGAMLQRDILAVFNRLARASTTPVEVGDLVSFYPKISDSGDVSVSMDGRGGGRGDQAVINFSGTPIPIIHSEASFGWRQWQVMTKGGGLQSADSLANNLRKVAEKLEDMVINGLSSIVVGGATIYGLKTFPDRNSGTYGAFNLNGGTAANWLTAFTTTLQSLISDNSFGQATVFVNYSDWFYAGVTDYGAAYPGKIAQNMLAIPGVKEVIPCSKLAANDIIAVNNIDSGEWGSILTARGMTTIPKNRLNPEDDYTFQVQAITAPQFRSDANLRSHIAAYTRS